MLFFFLFFFFFLFLFTLFSPVDDSRQRGLYAMDRFPAVGQNVSTNKLRKVSFPYTRLLSSLRPFSKYLFLILFSIPFLLIIKPCLFVCLFQR